LIPFSHPELNEISLNWASNFFKDQYIFREVSFKEIKGKRIVNSPGRVYLRNVQCADLIILPKNLPIERTPYKDIVDWRNNNLSEVNSLGGIIKLQDAKNFYASKLKAVATAESIQFTLGRLTSDLVNQDNYVSSYCSNFIYESKNAFRFSLKG
jgi:hypothetical protein